MTKLHIDDCNKWFAKLTRKEAAPFHWIDGGKFYSELHPSAGTQVAQVPAVKARLLLPNSRIFCGLHRYTHGAAIRGPVAAKIRKELDDQQTGIIIGYVDDVIIVYVC
jgi:hypothetical protein